MSRAVHYATSTLTRCGLSLSFYIQQGLTGPVNGNRIRHGDPKISPLVAHTTCKNCLRSMKKDG